MIEIITYLNLLLDVIEVCAQLLSQDGKKVLDVICQLLFYRMERLDA